MGNWPTAQDAQSRISACSQALLSHKLSLNQEAITRLMRAQARAALGNHTLTTNDFAEALRNSQGTANPDHTVSLSRAVEDIDRVIAIGPEKLKALMPGYDLYLFALVARGQAYRQLGQLGRSLVDFNHAIAVAPNAVDAYIARAELRVRRGEVTLARQDYEQALTLEPKNAVALAQRAALLERESQFATAISDLNAALATYPDNADLLNNRGYAYFRLGHLSKALADYDAALAVSPSLVPALVNRCLARVTFNASVDYALSDCDTAVEFEPRNVWARETRALALLKLGKPDAAAVDFDTVLEADPNRPISLYGRAICRSVDALGASLHQAAVEDRDTALTLDPSVGKSFAMFFH